MASYYYEAVKEYARGFKVPDFSRLWGDDVTDAAVQVPILIRLEYYLVRYQELALWTDPKSSVVALILIHLGFGYVATTTNTPINLALWLALSGFVYTTWVQRIWPEIRVEEDQDHPASSTAKDWTPVHPEVFSGPEIMEIYDLVKEKIHDSYLKALELRTSSPGLFCAIFSAIFLILAYLGSFVSAMGLLYYTVVGSFVIPGLVKILSRNQAVQSFLKDHLKAKDQADKVIKVPTEGSSQMSDLVQSVCSTIQSGMSSLSSSLPEMSQLKMEKIALKSARTNEGEDDLKPYMPVVDDETSQQILKKCADHGGHDPTQVESFHQDEHGDVQEQNSLIEGLADDIMPAHDEIDLSPENRRLRPLLSDHSSIVHHPETSSNPEEVSKKLIADGDDDHDEFLPSTSGTLLLSQTIDEMERSHHSQSENFKEVASSKEFDLNLEDEDEEDDFELISAEELKKV